MFMSQSVLLRSIEIIPRTLGDYLFGRSSICIIIFFYQLMSIIKKKSKYDRTADQLHDKFLSSPTFFDSRFMIHTFKQKCEEYFLYEGIDRVNLKWVNIYLKPKENNHFLLKRQQQHKKVTICPEILQTSQIQLQNTVFIYQVHERFGPSLDIMLKNIKGKVGDRQLLHLLLELIKLIEKINNQKLVCGELDLKTIVFDANPRINQLFLANCFKLQKKRSEKMVIPSIYCSKGVHLGRKVGIKDDLQSISYILIEVYTKGQFLADLQINQCMGLKITQKIQDFAKGLPTILIDFYHYVINLNYEDQINFFYWKNHLSRILTPKIIFQPYGFLSRKNKDKEGQQYEPFDESEMSELQDQDQTNIKQTKLSKLKRSISMIK